MSKSILYNFIFLIYLSFYLSELFPIMPKHLKSDLVEKYFNIVLPNKPVDPKTKTLVIKTYII